MTTTTEWLGWALLVAYLISIIAVNWYLEKK